jgi:hypothetical protein
MKTFANGIALWPDNPIYVFSRLRYPVGVDIFNGLLLLLHFDLIRGLVWLGMLSSLATFYAFYRWGGSFTVAGFLFNGGLIGLQFLYNFTFRDYQGASSIAWKSLPLSMFVTQRGLLYAIPAGLLLLWHWREKFFRSNGETGSVPSQRNGTTQTNSQPSFPSHPRSMSSSLQQRGPLPFWAELLLYGTMPLFHVHTFLSLSIVLVCLFAFGEMSTRKQIAILILSAVLPATFFVWLITDHFGASSMLKWQPGWVQNIGDFAYPLGHARTETGQMGFLRNLDQVLEFWFINFGFFLPLLIAYVVFLGMRAWRGRTSEKKPGSIPVEVVPLILTLVALALVAPFLKSWWYLLLIPILAAPPTVYMFLNFRDQRLQVNASLAFTIAGAAVFLFAYLYKSAPWEWDNLKLIFWAYFLVLPFLWKDLVAKWPLSIRAAVCIGLFGSGFVSLFGGLATGGYGLANRKEVAEVGAAVRNLPVEARFAAYPTWGHPLLLQGRKVVLGYPGHLWTQGFDHYGVEEAKLGRLMRGEPDWREAAAALKVRYIFWGREEQTNYPNSKRPWEQVLAKVASVPSGTIYDLQQTAHP